ncbi:MAG TPA: PDZ domain-containing protein [Spirochaetota bacterium]|jgi:membrane-associated protease RseP (regulator of RpoE activity)|nr:PDZ domain-containing protein [Spirochaetota bacterium]HQB41748.1 PDZ domain-containing protein [Candidatus Cloacimonadota bacterium]
MKNMKRYCLVIMILTVLSAAMLYANDAKIRKVESIVDQKGTIKNVNSDNESISENTKNTRKSAFMGIYTEELSLKNARDLNFQENYGVLITGVTRNSPADKQGLKKNDILMQIDDTKLENKDTLDDVLEGYYAGEKVQMTFFQNGEVKEIEFEFGAREADKSFSFDFGSEDKNKKRSVGYGGGTWMPIWVELEMDDVNALVQSVGFSKIADNGLLHTGFGGKIGVGKGFFIGGMGASYGLNKKTNARVNDENVIRRMKYDSSFGGVTLDKRFAISKNIIGSVGCLVGVADQTVEISQSNGDYNWSNYSNQINDSANNYASFNKVYIVAQPKAELLYRLTSWLGLRAEAGYIASYGWHNGWNAKLTGDTFEVVDSPNTKFDCVTVSVGPWFGF